MIVAFMKFKPRQLYLKGTLILGLIFFLPKSAEAVLPPDLVVSVGSQMAGFFAFFVVIIGSLFASLGILYVGFYQKIKKYSVHVAFLALFIALVVFSVLYQLKINSLSLEITRLTSQEITEKPIIINNEEEVDVPDITPDKSCTSCQFYSDSVSLFIPDEKSPFILELDLNRRQEPNGIFTHYYFLNGFYKNEITDKYVQFEFGSYDLTPTSYLVDFKRESPSDFSVRDYYSGVVKMTETNEVSFSITDIKGDFITRNRPEYTQFQSTGKALVKIGNETKEAFALVETLHSNDYEKRIFFPRLSSVVSLTHQFVLWDEFGNFYMIDNSEVFSDTPEYPSHSWLLYKSKDGETKKGFSVMVAEIEDGEWLVSLPELNNASLRLYGEVTYKPDVNGRKRVYVTGVISDIYGTRKISGLLKLVK